MGLDFPCGHRQQEVGRETAKSQASDCPDLANRGRTHSGEGSQLLEAMGAPGNTFHQQGARCPGGNFTLGMAPSRCMDPTGSDEIINDPICPTSIPSHHRPIWLPTRHHSFFGTNSKVVGVLS